MTEDRDQRIRERAYHLWDKAGRPEGESEQYWLLALAEINAEDEKRANDEGAGLPEMTHPEDPDPRPGS